MKQITSDLHGTLFTLLMKTYSTLRTPRLWDFYEIVREADICPKISKLTADKGKIFYEGNNYRQASVCFRINDDFGIHRTIHKSKGDQFDNVLV